MTQMISMGYGDVFVPLALLALWPILLVLAIGGIRLVMVMKDGADPSTFKSGVEHGPDRYWRLNRAHLNMQENMGIIAVVVLTAVLTGYDAGSLSTLVWVVLGARIVQTAAHIISGEGMMVNLRFGAYLVQIACLLIVLSGILTG